MDFSDVVVIGGVATGPKTAATLARRNPTLKITLFEKSKHISLATCGLPYFASGDVNSYQELTATPYGIPRDIDFFKNTKGFDIVTQAEVTNINRDDKIIEIRLETGETIYHQYDKLVIATGASPKEPPFTIPESSKITHFTRPEDALGFRQAAQTGQIGKAVIIGAGFIGCELTEAIGGMWGIETVLIEKENQILPYLLDKEMSDIVIRELKRNDVEVHVGETVSKIELNSDNNPVVNLNDGSSITADFVFICLGVRPNIDLAAKCGLAIGTTGAIRVNENLQTTDPDIYAGGDCIESISQVSGKPLYIPMGSLANRHGRVIAENIVGNHAEFRPVTAAFLVKIFNINVGAVGISQQAAETLKLRPKSVWGAFSDKPDYYPEGNGVSLKLIYDENDKLLGLQAVGEGDIARRIDSFSAILKGGGKIDDLLDFEHGYAPPFAEALDPLHHLAGMARAQANGFIFGKPTLSDNDSHFWLDVREIEEAKESDEPELEKIKNSDNYINIPLNNLRNKINMLDKNKAIKILCRKGPRSYQAAVILKAAGFENIEIVGGGTKALLS